MQFWHSGPLMLMVSLIAAINTEQTPQRLDANQAADGLVDQAQVQQQSNKDYSSHAPTLLLQLSQPGEWKNVEDKRNWNKMQGMWGKRSQETDQIVSSRLAKRAWSDLSAQGWGKRAWNQMQGAWGKRKWDQLHGAWGKRATDQQDDNDADDQLVVDDQTDPMDKRSGWNKMQGVWGKRSAADHNNLDLIVDEDALALANEEAAAAAAAETSVEDGAADNNGSGELVNTKRAWNQMQGAWGKRALSAMAAGYKRNWNNLRGAWGKREMPAALAKGVEWSRKRESGWNNLKGLWG